MLQKNFDPNNKYVSCIKIGGMPILPPLITSEKQENIIQYKHRAVKLEKHLERDRILRTCLRKYLPELTADNELSSSHPMMNTLEQQLTFGESAADFQVTKNCDQNVPCVKCNSKSSKFSRDLQVSQYYNNEFILLKHSSTNCDTVQANSVLINLAEDYIEKAIAESDKNNLQDMNTLSNNDDITSCLIRSNSYTLESPSPMLIEHLNKQSDAQESITSMVDVSQPTNNTFTFIKRLWSSLDDKNCTTCNGKEFDVNYESGCNNCGQNKNIDIQNISSSIDNNYLLECENSTKSCVPSISSSATELELKNISNVREEQLMDVDLHSLNHESRLTEFIDNNIPHHTFSYENDIERVVIDSELPSSNKVAWSDGESLYTESDTEFNLQHILDNVLQSRSKEIVEMLKKDKYKRELHYELKQKIREALLNHDSHKINLPFTQNGNLSASRRQTEECEVENVFLGSPTVEIVNEDTAKNVSSKYKLDILLHSTNISNSSRDFANEKNKVSAKEEWASTVLGAAVKGFLTRRLLQTDRVQSLIQTIKDALICAVQLHAEKSEEIKESDVELHRRLIQQVSAACFAFHDIFFSLSVQERMAIINLDRQKRREKHSRRNIIGTFGVSPQSLRKSVVYEEVEEENKK